MCTMSILAPDARIAAPSGSRPTRYEAARAQRTRQFECCQTATGSSSSSADEFARTRFPDSEPCDITQRMAPEMSGTTPPYIPGLDASGIREDTGYEPQA